MHDHKGRGSGSRRVSRLGLRAVAGIGAMGLLAAGLTVGTPAGAQTTPHATKFLACEVTDIGGLGDKSFNYSAYQGLLQAQKAAGGATKMAIAVQQTPPTGGESNYEAEIQKFINQHCNIIVTVGFLMDEATAKAANAHPTQKFAIVDDVPTTTSKNVISLTYQTNQDAFLGGLLSAAESKTGTVATYGGLKIPPVTIYMDGFVAGVRYYDHKFSKHVKVLGWTPTPGRNYNDHQYDGTGVFTGDFTTQSKGESDTKSFFSLGADIVFPVAGSVGLGSVAAVKTTAGKHYVDWVDVDGCVSQPTDCKYFPMSVTKGILTSVEDAILSAFHKTFKGQIYVGTLKNKGVALVIDKKSIVATTAEKAMVSAAITGIEKGTISVDPNKYPVVP
jgi:basic membrane protein A and related proteins